MFYSHEILTSREGGVATVWLVATLGSKSSSRKINRKAILDVDVHKTCNFIIQPETPMALRLQSNLLYGVSRVFSQQCGYVLTDAQLAQANMRALLKAVKTSELDPNAGKTRPDQIMIQDDPAFLPDLALPGLDIDLSALDISADESSRRSSLLSQQSQHSSVSSHHDPDESMLGLVIPTSDSGGAGDIGGFMLPGENVSSAQHNARLGRFFEEDDEGFNLDPGFTVDADGNLIEGNLPGEVTVQPRNMSLGSDPAASGRVRQELLAGLQAGRFEPDPMELDLEAPIFEDDNELLLLNAEPFPQFAPGPSTRAHPLRPSSENLEIAEAPLQRRRRAAKQLPVDMRQELRNSDLAQWKDAYVQNMSEAAVIKASHKAPFIAKKNAAFWVMGTGIGSVGKGLGSSQMKSPLGMFSGNTIMEALTGIQTLSVSRKRDRDEEDENHSYSEARRQRKREDDGEQVGRGDDLNLNDDDTAMMLGSDGIEMGRHAQNTLEDPSFPWNVSASAIGSRQGSLARGHRFTSSVGGFPTSAAGPSSIPGMGSMQPSSLDRRASRITSASPLFGRGRERYSSLELPTQEDDDEHLGGRINSSDQALDDFQLYGPAAKVDTQTAAQSQWVKATLDQEANNFLDFVRAQVEAIPSPADDEVDELSGEGLSKRSVAFETLLPPTQHTKIVAAQALHHVLALASRDLLRVSQAEAWGPIDLSLSAGI